MHRFLVVIVAFFALSACSIFTPVSTERSLVESQLTPVTSYVPNSSEDDSNLVRADVDIQFSEIRNLESDPPKFTLVLRGNLPTPCHRLDVSVQDPDDQNQIKVEAYAMGDPEKVCTQVLQPFDVSVDLGSFPSGRYTLWLNGEKVADLQK